MYPDNVCASTVLAQVAANRRQRTNFGKTKLLNLAM
jgi:hypothetical protein